MIDAPDLTLQPNLADSSEVSEDGQTVQLVEAQLPTMPLVVHNSVWVSRPNVHGWLPHQYDIDPHHTDVRLNR